MSSLGDDVVADSAGPYLAPEFDTPIPIRAAWTCSGLGAISYLVLTGEPPAPTRTLIERVLADGGLRPCAVDTTIPQALDEVVFRATRGEVAERLDSAERFLLALDETERSSISPPRSDRTWTR